MFSQVLEGVVSEPCSVLGLSQSFILPSVLFQQVKNLRCGCQEICVAVISMLLMLSAFSLFQRITRGQWKCFGCCLELAVGGMKANKLKLNFGKRKLLLISEVAFHCILWAIGPPFLLECGVYWQGQDFLVLTQLICQLHPLLETGDLPLGKYRLGYYNTCYVGLLMRTERKFKNFRLVQNAGWNWKKGLYDPSQCIEML